MSEKDDPEVAQRIAMLRAELAVLEAPQRLLNDAAELWAVYRNGKPESFLRHLPPADKEQWIRVAQRARELIEARK